MAKLSIGGIDEFERKLQSIDAGMRVECVERMLLSGADVLADEMRGTIHTLHHDTGSMEAAVEPTKPYVSHTGGFIEVYPQGEDRRHKIKQAKKAYILNTGRAATQKGTKKIEGDKFMDKLVKGCRDRVNAAMQAVLDAYVAGKE